MDVISYIYAALIFIGGLIGYFKAGSVMSLVSSSIIATLVVYGAYLNSQTPRSAGGLIGVCVFVAVFMTYRFFKTSKFIPAGLVAVISIFQVVRLLASLRK